MKKVVLIFLFFVSWVALSASSLDSVPYGRHAFSFEYRGAAGKWGAFYDYTFWRHPTNGLSLSSGAGLGFPQLQWRSSSRRVSVTLPLRAMANWQYKHIVFELGGVAAWTRRFDYYYCTCDNNEWQSSDWYRAVSPHFGLRWQEHRDRGVEIRLYLLRWRADSAYFDKQNIDVRRNERDIYPWWGFAFGYHF
jgi:hypothetical protein